MKRLDVSINCQAVYNSSIMVPDGLDEGQAIEYAKQHMDDIPMGVLDYVPFSDSLDEENCCFAD